MLLRCESPFGFVGSISGLPENGHDLQPADGLAERERHRRQAKMGVYCPMSVIDVAVRPELSRTVPLLSQCRGPASAILTASRPS